MTHSEIKSIVEEVGEFYFNGKYNSFFDSKITNSKNGRFRLQVARPFANEPDELKNHPKLIGRIYTQNFKAGSDCKEIGIAGRFVFDKIKGQNLLSKNIYLYKNTPTGPDTSEHINYPETRSFKIAPPHSVTVLNLRDLSENERKDVLRKFVSAYFEGIATK